MAGKKKQNPAVVRNRRVLIYTFLLILTLLYISGHVAAERQKRNDSAAGGAANGTTEGTAYAVNDGGTGENGIGVEKRSEGDDGAAEGSEIESSGDAGCVADGSMVADGIAGKGVTDDSMTADGIAGKGVTDGNMMGGSAAEDSVAESGEGVESPVVGNREADVMTAERKPEAEEHVPWEAPSKTETADLSVGLVLSQEELWCLILTNAEYPVPEDYEVELREVPGTEQSVDERIYEPLMEMIDAMKAEGLSPVVCSGYRTLDKQEKLFNRKVQSYVRKGHSKQESYELARQTISIPGSGEHCLGLAIDFFTNKYHRLETGFEKTPEGKWLREHAQDYGFTLRYDRGKEEITGIQYEPWHFRYVGVKAARYLKEHDLSLEEFYIEQSLYG